MESVKPHAKRCDQCRQFLRSSFYRIDPAQRDRRADICLDCETLPPTNTPMKTSWEQIKARLLQQAAQREENAAGMGSYGDGGASEARAAIALWEMGRAGQLPPRWQEVDEQLAKEANPEYQKLQELRKQFGQ
jgi:hypothetical protein